MTTAGAGGETALEMTKTLRLELPQDQLHDQMHSLQAFWKSSEQKQGIRLNLANRLWGQDGYRFNPEFLRITNDKYDAEIGAVDFAQPEASSRTINEWIENQTEKRIRNLVPAEALSDVTRLVLTNAVYFHGDRRSKRTHFGEVIGVENGPTAVVSGSFESFGFEVSGAKDVDGGRLRTDQACSS